jgi:hypothetical protein
MATKKAAAQPSDTQAEPTVNTKGTQMSFNFPKEKRKDLLTIKVNACDLDALKSGMLKDGEDNASAYIRRLIHKHA